MVDGNPKHMRVTRQLTHKHVQSTNSSFAFRDQILFVMYRFR